MEMRGEVDRPMMGMRREVAGCGPTDDGDAWGGGPTDDGDA